MACSTPDSPVTTAQPKPPRSTGPWPACLCVVSMSSPSASLIVGRAPGLRLAATATHEHQRQPRALAGFGTDGAAPASTGLKNHRPPMYTGQVVAPASAGTDGGLQPAVPSPNTRSLPSIAQGIHPLLFSPPKTIAQHKPTTEHRALARVPTRGSHVFVRCQLDCRLGAWATARSYRDS